jgi:two-component system, cell cycle sensor histidine kinase and response regulator CckA
MLTAGSLNLVNSYGEVKLHWIAFILLVFFAASGVPSFLYFRRIRQPRRDTAESAGLHTSSATIVEHEQPFRDPRAEMRMALEEAGAGTFGVDPATGTTAWSNELHQIYGIKVGEFGGRVEDWLGYVLPEDRSRALAEYQSNLARVSGASWEFRIRRHDNGEVRCLRARVQVLLNSEKRPRRLVGIHTDVTERLQAKEEIRVLEEHLRHAHKMEAIGRLASGVAHDFNNLLMVIRAHTELVQGSLPPGGELHRYTQEVLNASKRAAGLTTQLLAFSRKRILTPTVLNLNTEVSEATKMLKRLIGQDIHIQLLLCESLWPIRADADQIVQILMNLCVNSRDAMPKGGTITIQTSNSTISERGVTDNKYVAPGEYVVLAVEDTGVGASKQDMEHMFDPFFTTKPLGGGTGLGLSTVYGIVKQGNGYIWVDSELGKGTRFTIYFPRAEEAAVPALPTRPEAAHLQNIGTVLVVENETSLRDVICEFLRQRGYTTLSANSGEQALLISGRCAETIDLLLTDLVLPRMGGCEVSRRLTELQPKVKVIYMSGNAERSGPSAGGAEHAKAFLLKPFSLSKLAQTMQDVLTNSKNSDCEDRLA